MGAQAILTRTWAQIVVLVLDGSCDEGRAQARNEGHEGYESSCYEEGHEEGEEGQRHRAGKGGQGCSLQWQEGEDSWRSDQGDPGQEQVRKDREQAASARAKKNWAGSALKKW